MKDAPTREDRAGAGDGDRTIDTRGIPDSGAGADHKPLSHDTDAVLDFLDRWCGDGLRVLTAIPPDGGRTTTATFRADERDRVRAWIDEQQGVQNLYFTVNPTRHPVSKKPAKDDMGPAVGLHVDVDPRAGEALETERDRIRRLIEDWEVGGRKLPFPRPTVTVDSGGGYQCFWLLDAPVDDHAAVEAANKAIAEAMGGDAACHNIDRLMRLPGTVNVPGEKKRRRRRVERTASVFDQGWSRRYSLDQFPATSSGPSSPGGGEVRLSNALPQVSTDELPARVTPRTKMLIVNGDDPDDATRYPSRSEVLFAVLCELVRADVSDDMMAAIILDPDYGIARHVLEQPRPQQYAARQIKKAREAVAEDADPQLIEMNERHCFLTHEANGARIAEFVYVLLNPGEPDPVRQRWRWVVYMQNAADFRLTHNNRSVRVGVDKDNNEVRKPLGDEWLRWRGRRDHRGLTFEPGAGEVVGDKLNLWRGFAVDPAPGDWSLMRQHILEVLAKGDEAKADYIIRWLARAVQNPAEPAGVALVLRGKRGSGKGIFAHFARGLFGQHGFYLSGAAALGAKFNAHFRDTVLLYADEVKWSGNKNTESLLQAMITEPELMIEGKYKEATLAKNRLHVVMTSNEDWVVPAGIDERRFAVFGTSDHRCGPENKPYFDALKAQMDGGGLAAMLHDLLAMDISGFNPREIPESGELALQKVEGLTGAPRIIMEMLLEGIAPGGFYPSVKVGRDAHRRADPVVRVPTLIAWAIDRRIVRDAPSFQKVGTELKRLGIARDKFWSDGKEERAWGLPPLAEARRAWSESLGLIGYEWPEADEWISPPG